MQFVLAEFASRAAEAGRLLPQLALLANHKSVGMTLLLLAGLRLVWRFRHPPPAAAEDTTAWQLIAARATHWGFYFCMFLLPLSGWLMSSASAYSVSWFNQLELPDLVGPDETLKEQLQFIHESLAKGLIALAVLHVGAALKHALWDRDDILRRMLSWPAVAASLSVVVFGTYLLIPTATSPGAGSRAQADSAVVQTSPDRVSPQPTDIPSWQIDYADSYIQFTCQQAGAPFSGRWLDWQADIRFDDKQLANSSADVTIVTRAVSSNDDERDNTLRGVEFFDVEQFDTATFVSTDFKTQAEGFTTTGQLQIKTLRLPVEFSFSVTQTESVKVLTGVATIDRLAFNVGTGDWRDTTWVGQFVEVQVRVSAQP